MDALSPLYNITNFKGFVYDEFWKQPIIGYGHKSATAADDGCRATENVRSDTTKASIYQHASAAIRHPLWDEIDKIEDNLTGAQRQYLMQNQEYVNSLQYVSKLVQDEELRIIRPRIESTQQGQEALKKHLSLMQRLRKEVAQAEEQKSAMLNDYMTNHSDKTWQEYLVWYNKTHKGETKK